ncbi:DNA excision repair protein ERCC-6, partial [Stegodyphus mimosarum]
MKSDVKMSINLPNKSEQVLFCQLTEEQANLYKAYISSKEVDSILNARLQVFVGLINLRKICNHPDIFDGGPKIFKDTDVSALTEEEQYGYYKRSGKMIVVEALLRLWHKQGHRVLLFTQSRQMMEILEIFVKSKNYTYMKMDGTSSISSRQPAINKFNSNPSIFVFLLTTRVGGLGVNLTGADRVIIYDPDWNPSTDAQARERAWRIGQEKQVTIYRLLTAGTIEEKIYHRQIFKQFVTNRVLKDPRQRRFFKSNDLYELFTFNEVGPQGTETSAIFAGTGSEVKISKKSHKRAPETGKESAVQVTKEGKGAVSFSPEKLEQMKQLAKKLSLELTKKNSSSEKVINPSADQDTGQTSQISVAENLSTKQDTRQTSHIFVVERKNTDKKCISKEKMAKKRRKRKPAKVDGEKIDYVVKTDIYKPPRTEEEENTKQDDYVLSKLFKKSGVYTALKHDTIVEASDPDYMIVEGEAEKVAKQAIKALKESRRMCARASEGIPTWTGQHGGVKPRFGQKKKVLPFTEIGQSDNSDTTLKSPMKVSGKKSTFDGAGVISGSAPSSSDLLSAISERKMVFGTDIASDDDESSVGPTTSKPATQHDELLVDIRNFIAFRAAVDGQATTKEIVEAFRDKLPIQQNAVFKSLLSKICDFSRSSDGDGIWHLKEEFR